MESMKRGISLLIILGAAMSVLAVEPLQHNGSQASTPATVASDGESVASHNYSPGQVEYYLTDEEKSYVRPGLTVEIVDVEIPADRYPVVEVTFVDELGQPLDREGIQTPGDISMSGVIAW